jgi:hypothetical protein
MKRVIHALLVVTLCTGFTGCVAAPLLLLGAGALGGYAVSRDTFEGTLAKSQDEIWDASIRVASIMGTMDQNDRRRGEISSRIAGDTVTIVVIPLNMTTTKLRIKARKGIFPRIGTAQEVYAKILNQLDQ